MSAYSGKTAIVTGGASGIGRALVEALEARGAIVYAADLKGPVRLDVRDAEEVHELVDTVVREHGALDFMFNNAGLGVGGDVLKLGLDQWRRVVEVNILGVVHGVTAAYPVMV